MLSPENSKQFTLAPGVKLTKCSHKPRNSKQHAAGQILWGGEPGCSDHSHLPFLPSGSDSFRFLLQKQKGEQRSQLSQEDGQVKKKRATTAAVSLRCAALSHPEVQEKPLSPAAPQAFLEEFISHHRSPSPAFLGQVYSLSEGRHIPLPFSSMPGPQCT